MFAWKPIGQFISLLYNSLLLFSSNDIGSHASLDGELDDDEQDNRWDATESEMPWRHSNIRSCAESSWRGGERSVFDTNR